MLDLNTLYQGFENFRQQFLKQIPAKKVQMLARNQNPDVLIISCSDSRVDPAILLNFQLGEVFSIRNIANIIPPFQKDRSTYHGTSSALEYAIKILNIDMIIVLGHGNCGGIRALLEYEESEKNKFDYILEWVFMLKEAKDIVLTENPNLPYKELSTLCEKKSIEISLRNLQSFPFIKERIADGKLETLGLYFSLHDLHLEYYDPNTQSFQPVQSA